MKASQKIAEFYGVKRITKDFSDVYANSTCCIFSKSGQNVPHASFSDQALKREGAPVISYVPFRNGLFYSAAATIAIIEKYNYVYHALNLDGTVGNALPDASTYFNTLMSDAIYVGTGGMVTVKAPFIDRHKYEIIRIGKDLGVPFELTYGCYEGNEKSCGKCAACIDRLRAFEKAGVEDPLAYN